MSTKPTFTKNLPTKEEPLGIPAMSFGEDAKPKEKEKPKANDKATEEPMGVRPCVMEKPNE